MNRIQFQAGMSLSEFIYRFGTEEQCWQELYQARWPAGFRCPSCNGGQHSRFIRGRQTYFQCSACRAQTTLLSGTLFEATKLPLRLWFQAMYMLTSTKTNLAALELKRHLGVCYRTAWRLKQKIMQAMTEREELRRLKGLVQVDDAYLGGELTGGKPGRGSENKQAMLIAVETGTDNDHPIHMIAEPLPGFTNAAVADWCQRRLMPECDVYSDGLACFRRFENTGHAHSVLEGKGKAGTEAEGARWVNVVLANVKRSISGAYHAFRQAKYSRRYLAEAAYRFNRRFHLADLLPTLLFDVAACAPCPERLIRKATNYAAEVRR